MQLNKNQWLSECRAWKEAWPIEKEQPSSTQGDSHINLYSFISIINAHLKPDSVIVWDAGSSLYITNQALKLDGKLQRSIGSLAQAEMGAALGMAAGVSFAKGRGEVLCILGDGSFNTNIQALAIIKEHRLPVKIFILNNSGYMSIKNSQDKFYDGRRIGTSKNDGIFFPDLAQIASAYQILYFQPKSIEAIKLTVECVMQLLNPIIIDVPCIEQQDIFSPLMVRPK